MLTFSFYRRVSSFVKRQMFRIFFAGKFLKFGRSAALFSPDIIQGECSIAIGDFVQVNSMCWLLALDATPGKTKISIGDRSYIGRFVHIVSQESVNIENDVLIADKVYISDNAHGTKDPFRPYKDQDVVFRGPVRIGKNSWIGENVSIMSATIGTGCIIGANSTVTRDIPDYSIAVGSPAVVIKTFCFEDKVWKSCE